MKKIEKVLIADSFRGVCLADFLAINAQIADRQVEIEAENDYNSIDSRLQQGSFDALFIDMMGPESIVAVPGRHACICRHDTHDGLITGVLLSIILRRLHQRLPIVVTISGANVPQNMIDLCRNLNISLLDFSKAAKEDILGIMEKMQDWPKTDQQAKEADKEEK